MNRWQRPSKQFRRTTGVLWESEMRGLKSVQLQ
jgi:hypothetical protein